MPKKCRNIGLHDQKNLRGSCIGSGDRASNKEKTAISMTTFLLERLVGRGLILISTSAAENWILANFLTIGRSVTYWLHDR
jgi:hypothetical protein